MFSTSEGIPIPVIAPVFASTLVISILNPEPAPTTLNVLSLTPTTYPVPPSVILILVTELPLPTMVADPPLLFAPESFLPVVRIPSVAESAPEIVVIPSVALFGKVLIGSERKLCFIKFKLKILELIRSPNRTILRLK